MAKIYLPIELNNNSCPVLVSDGHIRIYDRIPNGTTQNNVHYTDFYIRDDYLKTEGTTNYTQYTNYTCMSKDQFTIDFWYRPDIWQSLISFFVIAICCLYFPYKIFSRFLGRWLKI